MANLLMNIYLLIDGLISRTFNCILGLKYLFPYCASSLRLTV
jgi:hypothetical protein